MKNKNGEFRPLFFAFGLACLIAAFIFVSNDDYKQELIAEAQYCANVKASVYPDYKKIYKTVCKKKY